MERPSSKLGSLFNFLSSGTFDPLVGTEVSQEIAEHQVLERKKRENKKLSINN